ncbi:MAG: PTS transporter subunit EIIC [Defluviitaleaceae bacterium]|nr:PTS transporter subunit EIIC [Defluviitaleaceae bacterium]
MEKRKTVLASIIDGISQIFMPIVGLLSAAGILTGIVTVLLTTSVLSADSDTHLVLNAMARSLFYFMPMMLAFTAAKKFGANPFTAVVIAGVLLYPSLNSVLEAGTTVRFLGIPLLGVTYNASIIPMILSAWLLSYVEKIFDKILPEIVRGFLTPLLSILIVGTVTLFVFGPVGAVIGDVLALGYGFLFDFSPIVAGLVLGAVIQLMVIFGFHWAIILIGMNNIALNGYDTVLALIAAAVFAQAGAAVAVMLKSKDKKFRGVCASAALSALFGVTEPAMFGVNLPRRKPVFAVCVGGGIGGAIAGFSGVQATAFAFPSIVALPVFLGDGFLLFLVSCAAGFLAAMVVTLLLKFDVDVTSDEE